MNMSRRHSLSRFVIPLVGAAVLTAGSLLFQMSRRPTEAPRSGASERPSGRAVPDKAAGDSQVAVADAEDGDTLLRRLRERGL